MARDASTLPGWIPDYARFHYSVTGPYSDNRLEQAMHDLFHSEKLQDFFEHLNRQELTPSTWGHLIPQIISAVECVPLGGTATRDIPDVKVRTRDKQAAADRLLGKIAKQARTLAGLLEELDLAAEVPGAMYSSLALLESAVARTVVEQDFAQFRKGLSSSARREFPCPARVLKVLAETAELRPTVDEVFRNDSWLRGQKSTWRDFIPMMRETLAEIHRMYGDTIALQEKHWVALVQVLISEQIGRSSVNNALRTSKA